MVVPIAVIELDEAHATFGETSGEQAIAGEGTVSELATVLLEDSGIFIAEVHEPGDTGLHLESHFILGDAGSDFGIIDMRLELSIELVDGGDIALIPFARKVGWVLEVEDGIATASELDALVSAREEAIVPLAGGDGLGGATGSERGEDDEAGEVG